uniref:uncharacterized protein LOC120340608 n=1 Tax=Styela clava TaxID=7725 RepID=UPI001939C2D7|nr:uncharacterized protein LOC120340608 [Styela clava]
MMRSSSSHHGWSPQQLLATLRDSQARERESWRHQLLSESANKLIEVGPTERDFTVTWMSQLNSRFNFYPETFFLAVHTLDRFLTAVKSRPKYLKCIAVTCFYVASKLVEEEEFIPGTGELVEASESGCRAKDVLRMERIILTKLEWDLHTPTPLTYLEIFHALAFSNQSKKPLTVHQMKDCSKSEKSSFLARHLNQLTRELQHVICNYSLAIFPSASIALALVSLEIENLTADPSRWLIITSQIQAFAKVKTNDLMSCRSVIFNLLPKKICSSTARNPIYYMVSYTGNPDQKLYDIPAAEHTINKDIIPLVYQGAATKRKANDINPHVPVSDFVKKVHTNYSQNCNIGDKIVQVCDHNIEQSPNIQSVVEAHKLPYLASGPTTITISQGERQEMHGDNTVTNYVHAMPHNSINNNSCVLKSQKSQIDYEPFVGNLLNDSEISQDSDWNSSTQDENDEMDSDGYDSDKTLTASEGEDEEYTERKKHEAMRMRPLTYAEIVKCGILETVALSV